jgi:protease I
MTLEGRRVAVLVSNEGVEQVELTDPAAAVRDAGGEVVLLAPEPGQVQAFHHLDKADTFPVDRLVGEASPGDFDALLLPGGVANPDQLRMSNDAVAFVGAFVESGRPVAVMCHGPWTLVEAGVVAGRTITSWPSLRTDIVNAGGRWVDEEVVVDEDGPGPLISSRKPDDLPRFCEVLVRTVERGGPAQEAAGAGTGRPSSPAAGAGARTGSPSSPAAGVLDPELAAPPEPSEPG